MLASAQCIVLATRSHLQGEVEIEIRLHADVQDWAVGKMLFERELLTTLPRIVVGSSLTSLHHL